MSSRRSTAERVAALRRGRLTIAVGSAAWALLIASCSAAGGPEPSVNEPGSSTTATRSEVADFANPVHELDFPDPMIIRKGDGYLAVATNGNGSNVQVATSPDLVEWTQGEDALPLLARWSRAGDVWAPEIAVESPDRSLLYYTTAGPDGRRQCISVAVGSAPEGPYRDSSRKPLVCDDPDQGGSIDPHPFRDADGRRYLYWKNDGNAVGADTYLWVQRLSEDGTAMVGRPTRLIKQDLDWEGNLIEAPFVIRSGSTYHLFYSANDYASWSYAEGHATATSPTGPFRKDPEPVLTSNDDASGPGGGALFTKDGRVWMAYHAWATGAVGAPVPGRQMWLSEVTLDSTPITVEPPEAINADAP